MFKIFYWLRIFFVFIDGNGFVFENYKLGDYDGWGVI